MSVFYSFFFHCTPCTILLINNELIATPSKEDGATPIGKCINSGEAWPCDFEYLRADIQTNGHTL